MAQVPVLMGHHEVILGESRGHGRSTRSEKPYSYHLMADDYVGLLDYLKIKKVALVGWSDGGIIGLDIAMRHPERLTKLWAYGANTQVGGLKDGFDKDPVVAEATALQRRQYERLSPTPKGYDTFAAEIGQMWNTQPDYQPADLAKITTPTMMSHWGHWQNPTLYNRELTAFLGAK